MADRVLVRRMAAAWVGGVHADAQAEIDLRAGDMRYQLWSGEIEVEALGVVARRVVSLGDGVSVSLTAVGCGHVAEFLHPERGTCATEVVAAVARDRTAAAVVDLAIDRAVAARVHEVEGMRLRCACRLVDFSPGRVRWLANLAADPALRGRMVTVTAAADAGEPRTLLAATPASAADAGPRVLGAHVLAREGKLLLSETVVAPC